MKNTENNLQDTQGEEKTPSQPKEDTMSEGRGRKININPPKEDLESEGGLTEGPEQWGQHSTYIGHGEWITIPEGKMKESKQKLEVVDTWNMLKLETENEDLMIAKMVREKGYPNMFGAKIPIKTQWNTDKLEQLLSHYHDKEVILGLRYGWPTGRLPTMGDPTITLKNHQGATDHPKALQH